MGIKYKTIQAGDVFDRLTVLRIAKVIQIYKNFKPQKRRTYWLCACECGSEPKEVRGDCLLSGKTQSCKCYAKEKQSEANTIHGRSGTTKYKAEWAENNPRSYNKTKQIYRKYKLTEEQFNKLLNDQNKLCAICKTQLDLTSLKNNNRVCIDHDHITNKVRSILCHKCNSGIGLFVDNIITINNAIKYLMNGLIDISNYSIIRIKYKEDNIRRLNDHLIKSYGITLDTFNLLSSAQNNCCAICKIKTEKRLYVDHSHSHPKPNARGLICVKCNFGLSSFNDSCYLLLECILYLITHNSTQKLLASTSTIPIS